MKIKDNKWVKWALGGIGAIVAGGAIMLGGVMIGYPAISQLVGLAVAQSATLWNNVKDGAQGDGLSNGVLAESLYIFNGTTFDRVRGDIANGMDVDVTRISGNVAVIGTGADNTTNSTAKLPVIPCRANASAPSWTEGAMVPCSTNLAGEMRTAGAGGASSPVQGTTLLNSETISAVDTAITRVLTGVASTRIHIYKIKALCQVGSSSMSIVDNVTTIYSTNLGSIPSLPRSFDEVWPIGLTISTGSSATITVGTCGPGNVGVLDIEADQF